MNIIVRDFVRPDPALVKGFEGIPTGVVSDAMGRGNSMAAEIKPVWPGAKVLGPAFTVRTFPADNLMIHFDILKLDGVLKSLGVVEK